MLYRDLQSGAVATLILNNDLISIGVAANQTFRLVFINLPN